MTAIAPVLQAFFTDRLMNQLRASPHTIASYRDTMRLLLAFACQQRGKQPSQLDFTDLDAPVIGAFLTDLETARGNGVTTRNARLTAIHSLFRYASLHVPEHAGLISRVLAIPGKRHDHPTMCFLTREEIEARCWNTRPPTWAGRRDQTLLLVGVQAGLRVSELTGLAVSDAALGTGPHVTCHGKGRKERATPLTPATATVLRNWLAERGGTGPTRYSRLGTAPASAATPSSGSSPITPPLPRRPARPCRQERDHAYAAALCGRPCYVAGSSISAGSRAARAGSSHITPVCYSQKRSSHARRSWSAVQSGRGSGVSDW